MYFFLFDCLFIFFIVYVHKLVGGWAGQCVYIYAYMYVCMYVCMYLISSIRTHARLERAPEYNTTQIPF